MNLYIVSMTNNHRNSYSQFYFSVNLIFPYMKQENLLMSAVADSYENESVKSAIDLKFGDGTAEYIAKQFVPPKSRIPVTGDVFRVKYYVFDMAMDIYDVNLTKNTRLPQSMTKISKIPCTQLHKAGLHRIAQTVLGGYADRQGIWIFLWKCLTCPCYTDISGNARNGGRYSCKKRHEN